MKADSPALNLCRLIAELKLGGYSQADIRDLMRQAGFDISQPTISRWANGTAEPSWSEGRWLLELHASLSFTTESLSSANPVAK